jgi:hypothetical protein
MEPDSGFPVFLFMYPQDGQVCPVFYVFTETPQCLWFVRDEPAKAGGTHRKNIGD